MNPTILMMLSVRFSGELKEVYRKALDSESPKNSGPIVESMVKSNLDKRTKREILEVGLTHREFRHRFAAELSLASLDNEEYSKRLLHLLERLPKSEASDPVRLYETKLVEMVQKSKKSDTWLALEKTIRLSPRWLRFKLLSDLSAFDEYGNPYRRERIRILGAFLDDHAVQTPEEIEMSDPHGYSTVYSGYELRNFATYHLAPYFADYIEYDQHRSNDEWACLRKWLKDEVAKELK